MEAGMALIPKILIVSNFPTTSQVGILRATPQRWEIALEARACQSHRALGTFIQNCHSFVCNYFRPFTS